MGWIFLWRPLRKGPCTALFCGLVLAGQMHAQEVIVAREKNPQVAKPPAQSVEENPVESSSPMAARQKARQKKAGSAAPTIEQMRMAGALAAEGLNERTLSRATRAAAADSQPVATATPVVSPTASPAKKQTDAARRAAPHKSSSRSTTLEAPGPVRPTMMESGREQPSATPSLKWQPPGEQMTPP
jgi:hypothetical protein